MRVIPWAARAIGRRWQRTSLTGIALTIGIASVVALIAIAQSSAAHTVKEFSDLDPDTITATVTGASWSGPDEYFRNASRTDGVVGAGIFSELKGASNSLSVQRFVEDQPIVPPAIVATNAGLQARGAQIVAGGMPALDISEKDPTTVLLGVALARRLGVSSAPDRNRIVVNGSPLVVTGLVRDGHFNSLATTAILLPPSTARSLGVLPADQSVIVRVSSGEAQRVSQVLAAALDARSPASVSLEVPPSTERIRNQLTSNLNSLILVVALITIFTSVLSITNAMQTAVYERRSEIGILMAMGASRGDVARAFLVESAMVGLLSGIMGLFAGVLLAAGVAALNVWPFLLPASVLGTIPLGLAVGAISGLWPAVRASRTDPAQLIRVA